MNKLSKIVNILISIAVLAMFVVVMQFILEKMSNNNEKIKNKIFYIDSFGKIAWSISKRDIVQDSNFYKLENNYYQNKSKFINNIKLNYPIDVISCNNGQDLVYGDLIFRLVDKFENLPFQEINGYQVDLFPLGCSYPYGYFDGVKTKRDSITNNILNYVQSKK